MSRATLHRRARSIPVTSVDSTGPTPELHPVVCPRCGWEGAPQREAWAAERALTRHQTSQRCQDVATGARPRDRRRTAAGCDPDAATKGKCKCPACKAARKDANYDITDRPRVRRGGVTRWSDR